MQEPIVLICSCKKYINTLHKAIERYRSDKYLVIGLIGDLTKHTSYENNILTLQVEDTYEYLPKKITSALYWITKNFPDTPGVFKTDDDIEMLNKVNFTEILLNNKYKDWWGLKAGDPMASLPDKKNIVKYNDLSLIDTLNKSIGKMIKVHYVQYRKSLPWRGDNYNGKNQENGQYMIDRIEKVSEANLAVPSL